MPESYPTHCLVYGNPGSGKSTFAATWPKPMLVFFFDPLGKHRPYVRRGTVGAWEDDERGTPCCDIANAKGRRIIRLEHYLDADVKHPEAYDRFRRRMTRIQDELFEPWKTVVFDSVTFMEIAKRKEEQYRLNKKAKHGMQWYARSKEALEEVLMCNVGTWPCNVIVTAHVSEDKDDMSGEILFNPMAVGKLGKAMPAGYAEMYRAYVMRDGDEVTPVLQTQSDGRYNACTQIPAPNPCAPNWKAMWE